MAARSPSMLDTTRGSAHKCGRRTRRLRVSILALVLVGGVAGGFEVGPRHASWTRGVAHAADTRPAEIPYDAPGDYPLLDPSYSRDKHQLVIITDDGLQPRSITLEAGQLVAWISYARAASTVVFEREVARSMICHSLVSFTIRDGELLSADIHTGEFASFCELKPGRYRYKVVRRNPEGAAAGGATRRLEGEIIVAAP